MLPLLAKGRAAEGRIEISKVIAPTVTERIGVYGEIPGWDCILHTPANWLLFNIPIFGSEQHVMNTQTGAWCRFVGWDARCFERFQDKLYYGGRNGRVYEVDIGGTDTNHDSSDNDVNIAIEGDIRCAYNYFGNKYEKRFTLARVLVSSDADASFSIGTSTDFNEEGPLETPTTIATSGARWNEAAWNVAAWAKGETALQEWQMLSREGTAISLRLRSSTSGARLRFFAADVVAERSLGIL